MARLPRFPEHRFVGTRDDMIVYDCDDADQYERLATRVEMEGLGDRLELSTFGPDTAEEARNRGFRAPR
jgi:hypothetical protein